MTRLVRLMRVSVAVVLAQGGLACQPDSEQPLESELAAAARERTDEFVPLAAAPGRFLAASGRISVPIPEGPGWQCIEEQHGDADAAAVALRCRREDPRELLFFAAKTHRQPIDQRTDAETVLMSLYRADNEAFFEQVEYTASRAATLAGAPGWEAELLAKHERLGPVRKRERLAIVGDRVFAISAEGTPALWDAHAAQIEAWFAGVEFALVHSSE
jgi:hypothetical protein